MLSEPKYKTVLYQICPTVPRRKPPTAAVQTRTWWTNSQRNPNKNIPNYRKISENNQWQQQKRSTHTHTPYKNVEHGSEKVSKPMFQIFHNIPIPKAQSNMLHSRDALLATSSTAPVPTHAMWVNISKHTPHLLLPYWSRNCSYGGGDDKHRRKLCKCNTALHATLNMLQQTCTAVSWLCVCGAAANGTVWHVEQGLVLACDRSPRTVVVYPSKGWKVVFHTLWHRTSEAACRFLNLNFLTTIAVVHSPHRSFSLSFSTSRSKYKHSFTIFINKNKNQKLKY